MPVLIDNVADDLEGLLEEMSVYLNRKTGEHLMLPLVDLESIRAGCNDIAELEWPWEEKDLPKLREIADDEDAWIPLPDKFDIHEWSIMEQFARDAPARHAAILNEAIHGRGAFRRFFDVLHHTGLADAWYAYKHEYVVGLVAEILDEEGVPYERGRA